jgi:hypothetical protein
VVEKRLFSESHGDEREDVKFGENDDEERKKRGVEYVCCDI